MPALDVTKSMLDAYAAVLEDRPVLVAGVVPGNRIYTSDSGYLDRMSSRQKSADFPYFHVYCNGGTKARGIVTHGTGSAVAEFDHPVAMTIDVELRLAFERIHDAAVTPLEAECEAAMASLLIYCRSHSMRWVGPSTTRKTRTNTRINSSTARTLITWIVSHECSPKLSQLIS